MSASSTTTTRALSGVFLTLLWGGFALPLGVKAACHDPLLVRVLVGGAALERLADAGAIPGSEGPSPPASPCAGLRCSGDPTQPWTPPHGPPPSAERWGYLGGTSLEPDPTSTLHIAEGAPLRPSHGGPTPLHPPR